MGQISASALLTNGSSSPRVFRPGINRLLRRFKFRFVMQFLKLFQSFSVVQHALTTGLEATCWAEVASIPFESRMMLVAICWGGCLFVLARVVALPVHVIKQLNY